MPRSQFHSVQPLIGRSVLVGGALGEDDGGGPEPAFVHFVIEQGDLVVQGLARATTGTNWEQKVFTPGGDFQEGDAMAFAVAVVVPLEPGRGVETITWSQRVRLSSTPPVPEAPAGT